jgi:FkbM family methyltransferase
MELEIIKTLDGTSFIGTSNDYLFSLIKNGNSFVDDFLIPVIEKHVKPDSVCIDCGANLGYVSIFLAKRCKKVFSIEPNPVVFLQLCSNLYLNQCFNVKPVNIGFHSHPCFIDFAEYQSGWVGTNNPDNLDKVSSFGSVSFQEKANGRVRALPVDDFVSDEKISRVDFLKIDAQGADIDILNGMSLVIIHDRPVIVFEYEDDLSHKNYNKTLSDMNYILSNFDYKMFRLFEENYLLVPSEKA